VVGWLTGSRWFDKVHTSTTQQETEMTFEANTNVELVKGIQETGEVFANQMTGIRVMLNALCHVKNFRGVRRLCEQTNVEFSGDSVNTAELKFVVNYAPEGFYNPKREMTTVHQAFEVLVAEHTGHREFEYDVLPEFLQLVVYVPVRHVNWVALVVEGTLGNIHREFMDTTKRGTLQRKGYKDILVRHTAMKK
jgi:hypothetical protein